MKYTTSLHFVLVIWFESCIYIILVWKMHPQYLQSFAYVGAEMQTYQNKHVHTYFMKKQFSLWPAVGSCLA